MKMSLFDKVWIGFLVAWAFPLTAAEVPSSNEDSLKLPENVTVLPAINVTAQPHAWQMEFPPVRNVIPRVLERSGIDLISRGPSFASDISVDGFKRSDIAVAIDNRRLNAACPNRMDVPVVNINPLEVKSMSMILSSADVSAGLGGHLNVETRIPSWRLLPAGYMQLLGGAEEGTDVGLALEGYGHGLYARYTFARPYVDAEGRTFQELYKYKNSAKTAYSAGQISLKGRKGVLGYGASAELFRDVLFPYLLMDERSNLVGDAYVSYGKNKLYVDARHHIMDNDLRMASGMMYMKTDAKVWTVGLTHPNMYNIMLNRWVADNTMNMNTMNMTQRMLDILQVRASAVLIRSFNDVVRSKLKIGAEYSSRQDGRKDLLSMLSSSPSMRRIFPIASAGLEIIQGPALIFIEGAAESVDPEYMFIELKRNGKPSWIGNTELRQPLKGSARLRLPIQKGRIITSTDLFATYVKDYVELDGMRYNDSIPIQTYRNVNAFMGGFRFTAQFRFFHIESHYTWAQNLTDDRPLSEIPPFHLRAEANPQYKLGTWNLIPKVALVYEDAQTRVNTALNETPTTSWYRVDLGLTLGWDRYRAELSVENLTNNLYYRHLSYMRNPFSGGTKVYEPGRRVSLSIWAGF